MNCYVCNKELIWGGDFDYEDYGAEGNGIVSNLSCPNCEVYVEVYQNIDKQNDKQNSLTKILKEKDRAMKRYTEKIRMEKYGRIKKETQ